MTVAWDLLQTSHLTRVLQFLPIWPVLKHRKHRRFSFTNDIFSSGDFSLKARQSCRSWAVLCIGQRTVSFVADPSFTPVFRTVKEGFDEERSAELLTASENWKLGSLCTLAWCWMNFTNSSNGGKRTPCCLLYSDPFSLHLFCNHSGNLYQVYSGLGPSLGISPDNSRQFTVETKVQFSA